MAQDINWFPGHMRKTLNELGEQLKLVDIVIETCDARIPFSSRNPELHKIISNKPVIVVLNKSDLADPDMTNKWISKFKSEGYFATACDSTHRKGLDRVIALSEEACKDKLQRAREKGRIGRPVRAMVVGVPNTGKSTLINALSGRKAAETGDRPGVTKSSKWVKTDGILELMDMPGVLWPRINSNRSKLLLAATGAIKDEVNDILEIGYQTMLLLNERYPVELAERFKVAPKDDEDYIWDDYERFQEMARKRGCILSGGRIDEDRFARLLLDDLRSGRIGRLTLEDPIDKE